ncbi:MAG: HAD-IIIC family phosphatase [Eubacterium sp.]|nr:HAD-IIIC family phosphatase [Eubacterium sp.]MCM1214866.1 HAD-IIIC family phosphatase [Lachnospiraceae bacterium]MCM1238942.1 HAD-IIIC family phosphatase [Lachnospiraceae bacterium]
MKIAVLSNVNMNALIRLLAREADVEIYEPEGYGNELGLLYDKGSSYHIFDARVTFLLMDLMELIGGEIAPAVATEKIQTWFGQLSGALDPKRIYYVSDAYLWGYGPETAEDYGIKRRIENIWMECLDKLIQGHDNVRAFPYAHMIEQMGEENAFSRKMWYMGKILLSNDAQKRLCGLLLHKARVESRTPRKILFLDLDNTLWGGLAGENDITPVNLSEDHAGLAYKNLQRVISQMQKQGVLLGIISRNNPRDALDIIETHPHMVLRSDSFAVKKINWDPKDKNIAEACAELNIGVDSAVFFDDSASERELVKTMLPDVAVPDFPDRPEDLAEAMTGIYHTFFEKAHITAEDQNKTAQYVQNAQRAAYLEQAESFEGYLKGLEMSLIREDPKAGAERFLQLVNKTNQFNLTTVRYTAAELAEILENPEKRVFLYRVTDRFGDNGQVAALIVDVSGDVSVIEEFTMSCRVMGKHIEHAIITDVEHDLSEAGFEKLKGIYIPTAKNAPVANLYEDLGYMKCGEREDGGVEYQIEIAKAPKRMYHVFMAYRQLLQKRWEKKNDGKDSDTY